MKKTISCIVALLICIMFFSCANSEKGNESGALRAPSVNPDLVFFELRGPVKKMTISDKTFEFDKNGNLTKIGGGEPSLIYSRDDKGRIVEEDDELRVEYFWDSIHPTGYYGPMIGEFSITYDERGFRIREESELTGIMTYSYDKTDKYGNWLSRVDNEGGKVVREIEYYTTSTAAVTDGGDETSRYLSRDLAFFGLYGPVKSVSDITIESAFPAYEFDRNGKLTSVYGTPSSERYEWDKQGRIVRMNGYENRVDYEWDSERPVASEASAEGMTLLESYTYDERGFVAKIEHTDDGEVIYEKFTYSGVDEYGNWTKRSSSGYEYTTGVEARVIEYYE